MNEASPSIKMPIIGLQYRLRTGEYFAAHIIQNTTPDHLEFCRELRLVPCLPVRIDSIRKPPKPWPALFDVPTNAKVPAWPDLKGPFARNCGTVAMTDNDYMHAEQCVDAMASIPGLLERVEQIIMERDIIKSAQG